MPFFCIEHVFEHGTHDSLGRFSPYLVRRHRCDALLHEMRNRTQSACSVVSL